MDDGQGVPPGHGPSRPPRLHVVDPASPLQDREQPAPERESEHAERLVPRTVKAALAVVGMEILLVLLLLAYLVSTLVQDVEPDSRMTWATLLFSVVMVLGLISGGFAVLRGRRWGRTPLICWQVLQLLAAAPSLPTRSWLPAAGLVGLSVVGLVFLLSPGVTRHLTWREIPDLPRMF